jgi:arylsulfatase A-like enzyme
MKPNIILFVTDDHGQWANSTYGNKDVHTPSLDFLAENGIVMENAFTPTPVCSPSRACIYTGRISSQHGVHDYLGSGVEDEFDKYPWMKNEKLISQILHDDGYHTGFCGKWHLGSESNPKGDFDYIFTIGPKYPVFHGGEWTYFENGEEIKLNGFKTDVITDKAVQFIREHDSKFDKPFFLIVGYTSTHSPWEGQPEELVDIYRKKDIDTSFQDTFYPFGIQNLESTFETRNNPREALCQYYAGVSHIDEGIGRIINEIYSSGQEKDTLTIYTSDHGQNCGHHGIWGKSNGTLPLNMVEESIRVPLIISYPGNTLYPQRRIEFVDHTDLFQTLVDFTGITLDPDLMKSRNYPGRSYYHLLVNDIPIPHWRDFQCCEYGDVRMVRDNRYKLVMRYPCGPNELFDLTRNPQEDINFFDDADYEQISYKLSMQLNGYYSKYQDPEKSGLRVKELRKHNEDESWRDPRNLH